MKTKLLIVLVCCLIYIPTSQSQCVTVPNQNTVYGTVFNDLNENGNQGFFDNGVEGVSIDLYQDVNGDGLIDSGDVIVVSETTDGSGDYTIAITQTTTSNYVADYFNSTSYGNNNGTENWFSNWLEIGENNGASSGNVRVENNALRFGDNISDNLNMLGDGVDRIVDLSTNSTASLNFDFSFTGNILSGINWSVDVQVSSDGVTYTTLDNISFLDAQQGYSYDISAYISAATHIRFVGSGSREALSNYLYFDNIEVSYTKQDAAFPNYIVAINTSTIPSGYSLSTNSTNAISFTAFGQANCDNNNDFGIYDCLQCRPIAEDDSAIVDQGESVTISVLDNDTDGNDNIDNESLEIVTEPTNGSVSVDDLGNIIYSPNGSFYGSDSFEYEVCDTSWPFPFCDTATVFITINENVIDPCFQAVQEQIYYIPFSDDELRTALYNASSTSCQSLFTNEVNRIISIKSPYPGTIFTYDHWEDGYEVDITNPVQPTTQVWGDRDINNGTSPEYNDDFIPSGGDIVLENTYNYNPRNSATIVYDGKDKLYTSNDISLSVIAGDVDLFDVQLAKTDVYNIEKFGTSFTAPFGEDLGQEFQYTGLFIRASEDNTIVNVDLDNDGTVDDTSTINEGEVMFVDGGVDSGAKVTSDKPVGVDLFFGALDCFGTRQVNILPGKFYGDVYYSPVPTLNTSAPSVVYFYNSLPRSISIDWASNINTGTIVVPANSSASLGLSDNSAYRFASQGGESYVASQVIDSDASGSAYDWAFNLITESRLTDFASIAWAPGNEDFSANYNPVWVTPTANTTLYIKYDGDLLDTSATVSPCGIPYDQSINVNVLNYTQLFDTFNNDNDQSGLSVYTCDGTKIFAIYGEDASLAPAGSGSLDVGTTMQPMCLNPLIFANDDLAYGLAETPIEIPVSDNDKAFLTSLNLGSITTDGLLQPQNGILTTNPNGTITYTPNNEFVGIDTFEYSICSQEFPDVCDIALVTVSVSLCATESNKNIVYGQVYFDLNEDMINNDNIGVDGAGINVYSDTNNNGAIDSGDVLISTVTTNNEGFYDFEAPNYNVGIVDDFSSLNYSGGSGWSTNWTEVNDDGNASTGSVSIVGSRRRLQVNNNSSIYRSTNLSGVTIANISFKVREYGRLESSDDVLIQICSDNTDTNCQTLFAKANDFVSGTVNGVDIDADKLTSTTTFKIITNGYASSSERFYIDDIIIRYEVNVENIVLETDLSSLPSGYVLSTDNIEVANFVPSSFGNCEKNNDFGFLRCHLTESNLEFSCNDNGTPLDVTDDFYHIILNPNGTRLGGSYLVSGDITGSGNYGSPQSFGPFLVSDGNKLITITDNTGNCAIEDIEISVTDYSCLDPNGDYILDFDGVDDYLSGASLVNGLGNMTFMAWVKIDAENSANANSTIAGEGDAFRIYAQNGNKIRMSLRSSTGSTNYLNGKSVNYDEWHHVTFTFSNATGKITFYIDGEITGSLEISNLVGQTLNASHIWNGNFELGRISLNYSNKQYFNGAIDEVRVFDIALTEEQVQQMVYQEITKDVSGDVIGEVLPMVIEDTKTLEKVSWTNLIGYYPMTIIENNTTLDQSDNNNKLTLNNITSVQEETAPMPYQTSSDGDWDEQSTWLHGEVWDIEDAINNKDWSIVHVKHNLSTSNSHTNLGLIIDDNKTLTVNGDQKIENNLYLELNGTIDLQDDSQLIQTKTSDLVTSATGKILRRQEGNSSVYWYNYWASPTGALGVTTLSDNNLATHNPNNNDHRLGMLKKPNGSNFEFTGALNETGKISVYWLYTYKNGVTYYDYASLDANSVIEPGVGYTQKGTGVGAVQQYVFEGKPNNGTIQIPVTDTGGPGSVPTESKTDYLLGNPYASAIDLHQFIDDNAGVIDGTINLWQQWSGSSHYLDEYDGGYAQVNKLGSVRAYQFVGIEGETNGNQDGTKTPSRYLPVGQGFMAEIIADGQVEFNNGQRVFVKEADADGSYGNGSVFFRPGEGKTTASNTKTTATQLRDGEDEEDVMKKIRLEFSSVDGPSTRRELLLGFSEATTDDYDYGYDAKNAQPNADDLTLVLGEEVMNIQAYGPLTDDKVVPLALQASGNYNYTIKVTGLEEIDEDQEIYIKDNLTGDYFDVSDGQVYEFSTEAGEYKNRLEIVFRSEAQTLSQVDQTIEGLSLYYALNRKRIVVLNPRNKEILSIKVYNILGQSVYKNQNVHTGTYNEYQLQNLSTGSYIIELIGADNTVVTKKVIIN